MSMHLSKIEECDTTFWLDTVLLLRVDSILLSLTHRT